MSAKRDPNFPLGKVRIDGTNSTTSTVAISQSSTNNNVKLVANSGVDIGDVDVTSITPPSSVSYGRVTVTTSGTEVQGGSVAFTQGVTIRALTANTGLVVVGSNNSLTVSNGYQLAPGESIFIACNNLSLLWFDAAVNGEGVSYIGS